MRRSRGSPLASSGRSTGLLVRVVVGRDLSWGGERECRRDEVTRSPTAGVAATVTTPVIAGPAT
jgi:hypothetical protein